MKRIIVILLIIASIGTTTFTVFGVTARTVEASGGQSSASTHNNSQLNYVSGDPYSSTVPISSTVPVTTTVPLLVGVSGMSVSTGSSTGMIPFVIVALGLMTTAALVWDRP